MKTLAYADVTGESAAIVIALQVNICWLQSTVVSLTGRNSCATQIRANPFLRREGIALSSTSIDDRRPRAQQFLRSQGCVGLLYVAVPRDFIQGVRYFACWPCASVFLAQPRQNLAGLTVYVSHQTNLMTSLSNVILIDTMKSI